MAAHHHLQEQEFDHTGICLEPSQNNFKQNIHSGYFTEHFHLLRFAARNYTVVKHNKQTKKKTTTFLKGFIKTLFFADYSVKIHQFYYKIQKILGGTVVATTKKGDVQDNIYVNVGMGLCGKIHIVKIASKNNTKHSARCSVQEAGTNCRQRKQNCVSTL